MLISPLGENLRMKRVEGKVWFVTKYADYAPVAQWIEQWSSKPRVGGSNPSRRATISESFLWE